MRWYRIIPRIDSNEKLSINSFGAKFVLLLIKNDKGFIDIFLKTGVSKDSLTPFFDVEEETPKLNTNSKLCSITASYPRKSYFYEFNFRIEDLPTLIAEAEPNTVIVISASLDSRLRKLMYDEYRYAKSKEIKYRRQVIVKEKDEGPDIIGDLIDIFVGDDYPKHLKGLESKINDIIYLIDFKIIADSEDKIQRIRDLADALVHPNLSWSWKRYNSWDDVLKVLEPPKLTFRKILADIFDIFGSITDGRLGWGIKYLNTTLSDFRQWFKLPSPSAHKLSFARGLKIPALPRREDGFRIGVTEDGREVKISIDDLFQHCYVIGQTRAGKTTFLRLLAHKLHECKNCAVIVIDPHGDLAKSLAEEIPDALYFHPIYSPFGINPLELPKGVNRDHAISLGMNAVVDLFMNVLKLPETAHYVQYVLRVIMKVVYAKTDEPTFSLIDEIITRVREGEDILIDDPEFRRDVKRLRDMPIETLLSTFSRLFRFAGDPLLKNITSKTTIPVEELIKPGKITLFAIPIVDLTEENATLLASAILLKLWFEVQARARENGATTPVFVICDEFQIFQGLSAIDTILCEARKFGFFLIMAHQHTKQLDDRILQSVLTNSGLKLIFQVGGDDINVFRKLDPSFSREIESIIANLPRGHALLKISSKDENPPPPFVVKIDYPNYPKVRQDICTKDYAPPEIVEVDKELVTDIFNPLFKFIDKPAPVEQKILYLLYKNSGTLRVGDILSQLPVKRGVIDEAIANLSYKGLIEVERRKDSRILHLKVDFLEQFKKVAPSEKGMLLLKEAVEYYLSRNYYVGVVKQVPGMSRPDLVAIPLDDKLNPKYKEAVAVEIEAYPEDNKIQLQENISKDSVRYFKEVHVWTFEEYKDVVEEIVKEDYVKTFYVQAQPEQKDDEIEKVEEELEEVDQAEVERIKQEIIEASLNPEKTQSNHEELEEKKKKEEEILKKQKELLNKVLSQALDEDSSSLDNVNYRVETKIEPTSEKSGEYSEQTIVLQDGTKIYVPNPDKAKKVREYLSKKTYEYKLVRKGQKAGIIMFYDKWHSDKIEFSCYIKILD